MLAIDPIWKNFVIPHDFESYCRESIPVIRLKDEVHEDVKEEFRVINKLIEHSFFEYKFYDVATLKCVLALEMALSIRYEEINNKQAPDGYSMNNYLEWFHKRNYFEVYNDKFLEYFVFRRNSMAHPKKHSFVGPLNRDAILYCGDLINDLYEDPLLREKRIAMMKQLERRTRKIYSGCLHVKYEDGKTDLAFLAKPCFINNKVTPLVIIYVFMPLLRLPRKIEPGRTYSSPLRYVSASGVEYTDDSIIFTDSENKQVIFSKLSDEKDKKRFERWRMKYEEYNFLAMESASIHTEAIKFFSQNLRNFHFCKP